MQIQQLLLCKDTQCKDIPDVRTRQLETSQYILTENGASQYGQCDVRTICLVTKAQYTENSLYSILLEEVWAKLPCAAVASGVKLENSRAVKCKAASTSL